MLDLCTKIMAMTLVWLLDTPPPLFVCVITCCLLPVTHFSSCSNSLHGISEGNSVFLSFLSFSCCCGVKSETCESFSLHYHLDQTLTIPMLLFPQALSQKSALNNNLSYYSFTFEAAFPQGRLARTRDVFAIRKLQLPQKSNGKESPCNIAYHCTKWTLLT